MSDQKKLNKRLNDLFADLEGEITQPPDDEKDLSGWTWEVDSEGRYSYCSPEVEEILGIKVDDFIGKPLTTFRLTAESQSRLAASLESIRPKRHAKGGPRSAHSGQAGRAKRSELTLQFLTADEFFISARLYIIYTPAEDGAEERWRGFTQIIQDKTIESTPSDTPTPEPVPPAPLSPSSISSLSMPEGIAVEDDQFFSVSTPFSPIGEQSLELRQTVVHEAAPDIPAAMAVPVELEQQALGLLEFIDENPNRHWSREEQRLVEEVAGQLSLALENARLFEETQRRAQELSQLNEAGHVISTELDLDRLTGRLVEIARNLLNAHYSGLLAFHPDATQPPYFKVAGVDLSQFQLSGLPEGKGILSVILDGETVMLDDISKHPRSIGLPQQHFPLKRLIGLPLVFQEHLRGILLIGRNAGGAPFTEADLSLSKAFANTAVIAIENARLFQQTIERSQELALINRVVSQVAASLDVNEGLKIVTTELANALDIQVNIALLNPDGASLTMAADYSPRQENPFVVGYEIPITGNPSTEKVFETKKPVIIEDPQTNPLIASIHDLMRSLNVQSMGIFPMIIQDEIYGTVGLYILDEGRSLTQSEIQLVETILVQATTAVQNARLFEQIQTRSTQLQTAAEISRAASSILEPNPLIMQAVNLIRDRFDLYYTGIFLVDESGYSGEAGRWAVLRAGTGEAGSIQVEGGHKLEIGGDSMIGQCISTAKARISQIAPDEIQRFANPYLPDTQSEMALPLISRGKVIGAMTIQSVEIGAFSEEDVSVLQTMADQVANALQNANLFNQTQQNATELSILNDMSLALSRQLDINEIIQTIHQYTSRLMDTTYFFVALYDSDEDMVSFPLVVEKNATSQIPAIKKRRGLTQHVIDTKEPLLIYEDVEQVIKELGLEEIILGEPAQSWLGVPLLIGDEVLGVITTQNATRPRIFNTHHQELLVLVARQSAIALRNAQLFTQTQEALAETEALLNITNVASRSLELRSILDDVLDLVLNAADFESGVITIYDPKTEKLDLVAERLPESMLHGLQENGFKGTLCELVFTRKEPVVINNFDEGSPIDVTSLIDLGFEAYLGVPLESRGEVLGTLCSFKRSAIDPHDVGGVSLMQGIGQQVGVAIENANLFEQTQRQLSDISTIQETTADLSAALTLDGVVNTLLAHLTSAVQADSASVFSIDGTRLIRVGIYPSGGESSPEIGQAISLKDYPLTQHVIDTQEPLAVSADDEKLQEHAREAFKAAGIAANATIPILGPEGVLGTISVSRNHPANIFSDSELKLMSTLANQAAVAILNARSYERVQEVAEEMSMLFDISQELTAAPLGVAEIADVIARNFVEVLSIPECSISLLNPENNTLEIVTDLYIDNEQRELHRDDQIGTIQSLQQYPATDRVMRTLQPLVVQASDSGADPAELAYMNEHDITTLIVLPLAVKGQAIGVLELESWGEERYYTQSELNLAMTLANQAAVALDNARLYEEQREITEQLRELDKLKSQFLANMSHELRTPLNSIIGFSRVIMKGIDGPVTDQQQQDLSAIYNAGQHLLNMINDILDISKIEAGKMELAFEDVNLPQIIESVLSTARGLVKDKPVELRTDIPDDLPVIHADPTRIRQILLNLLSNASKFTDEGSITVKARQQTGPSGRSEIYIGVIDTGVGIALEDQQGLFEPFTQVDGSATRKTGGTGLGLSITRLLVDLHDGEIGIDSKPGAGSTFYFTLPVVPEEKFTVLAIDGDPQVTELYQRYLSDTKYQIITVLNTSNALEMARELKPFAITLDVNLPEHDGWEIFQTIRDDPDTKHIPIVICSLKDDPDKAQNMGAADYLPKPILRDDLINALNRILSDDDAEE